MPRTTERKVYFFRAHGDRTDGGRVIPYDVGPALNYIDTLTFASGDRYRGSGAEVTCCWPTELEAPPRVEFGKVRRADLPTVEEEGNTQPLDLTEDQGIVEKTHFVFFPNYVLGMLYNYYGPRRSSLARYLGDKHGPTPESLEFTPLLRQDVLDALDKFGRIRVLRLGVLRSFLRYLEEFDESLYEAFEGVDRLGNAPRLELVLRPEAYQRDWIEGEGGLMDMIRRLAERVTGDPEYGEQVKKFEVKGLNVEEESVDEVDVLNEKLVRTKQVVRLGDRSRSIQADSAYDAIIEAYEELQDQLNDAVATFDDADERLPA